MRIMIMAYDGMQNKREERHRRSGRGSKALIDTFQNPKKEKNIWCYQWMQSGLSIYSGSWIL